jgi:hypothetical protein
MGQWFFHTGYNVLVEEIFLAWHVLGPGQVQSDSLGRPGFGQNDSPIILSRTFLEIGVGYGPHVGRRVMRHVFHRLEPVVRVAELGQNERVLRISRHVLVLEPMLVASQTLADFDTVIEAFGHMTVMQTNVANVRVCAHDARTWNHQQQSKNVLKGPARS